MTTRTWTLDPFACGYYVTLTAFLEPRKGVTAPLNADLLARLRVVGETYRTGSNTPETTLRRVSWACYVVSNIVLERLDPELVKNMSRPEDRPNLSDDKLLAFEAALRTAVTAANVGKAEHAMTDSGRGSTQLQGDRLTRLRRLVIRSLELIERARAYFQASSKERWADFVGHDFFYFLVDAEKTSEELVEFAEKITEVHA